MIAGTAPMIAGSVLGTMTHLPLHPQTGVLGAFATQQLVRLGPIDILLIAIYFALVIFIGFYLKQSANTGEEFFMAGRQMTAWIAGLSFVSANLGSLELMGWAGWPTNTGFWRPIGIGSAPFPPCSFWAS